jgi:hypothetical protein blinB_13246
MNDKNFLQKHGSNIRELIHGGPVPGINDPAENYLQASKLTREGLAWETPMIPTLMESEDLQRTTMRSARRYDSRVFTSFKEVTEISKALKRALSQRRSTQQFKEKSLKLSVLASVLENSYGAYDVHGGQTRRNTPSGGALYPLDIFIVTRDVTGLTSENFYFFDPFRHGLTDMAQGIDLDSFRDALLLPDAIKEASAFIIISASIWRCRFKYAQRAYRFCCIESGHLAQNLLTVATDLGLGTRIFGGFIDNEIVSFLPDINGIDDVPMYIIALGERA